MIKFKRVYFSVYALLFLFSFTYFGNHGLGDEAIIPLGHWKTMDSTDGYAYFNLKNSNALPVDSFVVSNDHLYFASENEYYDYQLASGRWEKYRTKNDYEIYASEHKLPLTNQFKTFYPQYNKYWNDWRFWFLP